MLPALLRGPCQLAGAVVLALAAAGCMSRAAPPPDAGTATATPPATTASVGTAVPSGSPVPVESNPPGDIPDSVAYLPWTSADRRVTVTHPEGWAQRTVPGGARFSDKLNAVAVTVRPGALPSLAQARGSAPGLAESGTAESGTAESGTAGSGTAGSGRAFELRAVEAVRLPAGPAVRVTWRVNSTPDEVTGKVYRDEVVTYLVGAPGGRLVRLDLSGPVGADNVDPYRIMSESLRVS
ncbi:MAG TPA: hypothetical protein VLJ59_03920 [Mycobacteriales bacterium]|nr:hypothetical protein [Mycobacteriales bacterium]